MKFTEEQIKKLSALREELRSKIIAFDYGADYGMRKAGIGKRFPQLWIMDLRNEIDNLMLENLRIGNIYIEEFSKKEFDDCLEAYFTKIYDTAKHADDEAWRYLNYQIDTYKSNVKKLLS